MLHTLHRISLVNAKRIHPKHERLTCRAETFQCDEEFTSHSNFHPIDDDMPGSSRPTGAMVKVLVIRMLGKITERDSLYGFIFLPFTVNDGFGLDIEGLASPGGDGVGLHIRKRFIVLVGGVRSMKQTAKQVVIIATRLHGKESRLCCWVQGSVSVVGSDRE